ncbi:MAG TPA: hypothetical protein PK611_09565 [Saprospiraceae bacterium]|nr:hypothetical protein [Saprospiraceae bacterium]HRO07484.1 hypothetical protein [Saprospiraceae bacterium]HRO73905.1 hypothetical protein [Saprospiraceae bacterium]HRP40767.1 hypothetical protein [Saprospiraceae bacterium]
MEKISAYLLIIALMLRVFYADVHILWYNMNTASYVSIFCENKDNTEILCNGKCSINKVLKDNSGQEQEQQQSNPSILSLQDFIPCDIRTLHLSVPVPDNLLTPLYAGDMYFSTFIATIIHPPEV